MSAYIFKLRRKFDHKMPTISEHSPYKVPSQVHGSGAQYIISPDKTTKIDDKQTKIVYQVIGRCLY